MYPGADSSQLRAEIAVMRIFRSLGVPADVFLTGEEISREWPAYGVRAGDLAGAIDRLVKRGLLARRHEAPDQIALTVAGSDWFDEQPGWLEYHLLVPRVARARFKRDSAGRGLDGTRRRREDTVFRRGKG